jgi:hypothetical protein
MAPAQFVGVDHLHVFNTGEIAGCSVRHTEVRSLV